MNAILLFLVVALLAVASSVRAAEMPGDRVWFGGEDPVTLADKHRDRPSDFMALFAPDASWKRASSDVGVFKISMQFASRSTDADLQTLIVDLRRRDIALGIEMGMLRNDRGCGKGEGYMPKETLTSSMQRIRRLGGRIDDVAMDEIVFFGREKTWPDRPGQIPCRDSIDELVNEAAASARSILQIFPDAKIGSIEPITSVHDVDVAGTVRDYPTFADRFAARTGSPLAFLHADIAWRSQNWQSGIAPLKTGLRARGIPFGIIVGGDPDDTDDVSWTDAGLKQLKRLAANETTSPDQMIVQSWQPFPTRYLPENEPGTSTWMLLQAETLFRRESAR